MVYPRWYGQHLW